MPIISVLLPVYNGDPYVREAIESTLTQSFSDFELLIINDGSTDRSLSILREYEVEDRRIRIISRENRGLVTSLNDLLSEARGRYIARMDQDDVCLPQRFQRQLEFLDARLDYAAVGGWILQMNERGLPIGVIRSPCGHDEIDQANLRGHCSIWHPTAMIRKDSMLAVGGYRGQFGSAADLDLWLRMAEVGKIANIPEVVLRYRLHPSSTSQLNVKLQHTLAREACVDAWKRRDSEHQYEAFDLWRPGGDNESLYKFTLQYGWTAWSQGYRQTWRFYAREALRMRPLAFPSWKLLIFGFLKRPRSHN
jgi:glycosyltransferase involved in cell wall biosynthesis